MLRLVFEDGGRWDRREWLRAGLLGGWAALRPARAAGAGREFGKADSVIFVYANGGQSQLDTWDPKPDAPAEIRGEFAAIPTAVPGTLVCEHMPRLARLADRFTIIRSISHDDLDHGSATYLALTGRPHSQKSSNPPPMPNDYPTYGSLLERVRPSRRFPHTAVHVNGPALTPERPAPGQFGGLLGHELDPLVVGDVTAGPAAVPNLSLPPELPTVRLSDRMSLLRRIEEHRREWEQLPVTALKDSLYRQAVEMLGAPRCRAAFDLSAEPARVRDRYGGHRSGQACLLARRLVEAGVPWITVMWNHSNRGQDRTPGETDHYGWDTHNDIFGAMKIHLLPRFDESLSALLEDLDQRGLLERTLVVCVGEFGRAPHVAYEAKFAGRSPGRKHWASVYSGLLAGAGVAHGAVHGASDRIGGHPITEPVGPWDIAATMFSALGIDPASEFLDPLGRPAPLSIGRPITGLYG